jgi:hypothetical protein
MQRINLSPAVNGTAGKSARTRGKAKAGTPNPAAHRGHLTTYAGGI